MSRQWKSFLVKDRHSDILLILEATDQIPETDFKWHRVFEGVQLSLSLIECIYINFWNVCWDSSSMLEAEHRSVHWGLVYLDDSY